MKKSVTLGTLAALVYESQMFPYKDMTNINITIYPGLGHHDVDSYTDPESFWDEVDYHDMSRCCSQSPILSQV